MFLNSAAIITVSCITHHLNSFIVDPYNENTVLNSSMDTVLGYVKL